MIAPLIRPTPIALAISRAYGYHLPRPQTALRWLPCPNCAPQRGMRLTECDACANLGRMPVLPDLAPRPLLAPGRLLA